MTVRNDITKQDSWAILKKYTDARIALGRTGVSIPVRENLAFKMAHAHARDAIYTKIDTENLLTALEKMNHPFVFLHSKAKDREQYLQRPDLGRSLDDASHKKIEDEHNTGYDICINIADGLSATAVNFHALPLLQHLMPLLISSGFSIAPICVIEQGRVAISDETGELFKTKISLMMIGERPGLSSPDSLGAYLTYQPRKGNTDALRNCISNIRPKGLLFPMAAEKLVYLIKESLRLQLSGVALKDITGLLPPAQ